jgi:hypothetical protein
MNYPLISKDPGVQKFYESMRRKGESHSISEMCAMRSAPRGMTDSVFFAGVGTLADQFLGDEAMLEKLVANATAKGHKPSANSYYCAPLANEPGDPLAFIPPSGGRGHVQAVCEQRGWACDGSVKVKGRKDEPKKTRLATDIVNQLVDMRIAADPDQARVDRRDLQAEVISKHGAQ